MTDRGPYRTLDRSETRARLIEAIEHASKLQREISSAVRNRNQKRILDTDDLAMVEKLNSTLETACNHERELLKQLAELERA